MSKEYNEGLNVATLIEYGVNGDDCKEFIDGVLDGMFNSPRTLQHNEIRLILQAIAMFSECDIDDRNKRVVSVMKVARNLLKEHYQYDICEEV